MSYLSWNPAPPSGSGSSTYIPYDDIGLLRQKTTLRTSWGEIACAGQWCPQIFQDYMYASEAQLKDASGAINNLYYNTYMPGVAAPPPFVASAFASSYYYTKTPSIMPTDLSGNNTSFIQSSALLSLGGIITTNYTFSANNDVVGGASNVKLVATNLAPHGHSTQIPDFAITGQTGGGEQVYDGSTSATTSALDIYGQGGSNVVDSNANGQTPFSIIPPFVGAFTTIRLAVGGAPPLCPPGMVAITSSNQNFYVIPPAGFQPDSTNIQTATIPTGYYTLASVIDAFFMAVQGTFSHLGTNSISYVKQTTYGGMWAVVVDAIPGASIAAPWYILFSNYNLGNTVDNPVSEDYLALTAMSLGIAPGTMFRLDSTLGGTMNYNNGIVSSAWINWNGGSSAYAGNISQNPTLS